MLEDFDGVTVEDGNDWADEGRERAYWVEQEQQKGDRDISHHSRLHYCCFASI